MQNLAGQPRYFLDGNVMCLSSAALWTFALRQLHDGGGVLNVPLQFILRPFLPSMSCGLAPMPTSLPLAMAQIQDSARAMVCMGCITCAPCNCLDLCN